MSLYTFLLYFFMAVAGASAIAIACSKNVFKAALFLLACLLSVAALYVLAFAEFIAIAQILIYAGGILVLIIFGIMLTSKLAGKSLQVDHAHLFSGILAGATLFILLVKLIAESSIIKTPVAMNSSVASLETIGVEMLTTFALPFELTGILLLMSLIGAAVLASFKKTKNT